MSSASLFDLGGRVALVTGGNGGIGRSVALGLAQAGASVAIAGRDEDKNARVLAELQATGNPAGRWGQPEELIGAAVFLASTASDFVTGETVRVDGGYAIY